MESIGEKLRASRAEKGYTLEQVARDTHIAKRYIVAMEEEEFSLFPGEPYLIGFLRNYSAYLGLNPQEIVSLYKNLQLQEQPAPMNELLDQRSSSGRRGLTIVLVAVVVIALVLGVLYFATDIFEPSGLGSEEVDVAADDGETEAQDPAIGENRDAGAEAAENQEAAPNGDGDRVDSDSGSQVALEDTEEAPDGEPSLRQEQETRSDREAEHTSMAGVEEAPVPYADASDGGLVMVDELLERELFRGERISVPLEIADSLNDRSDAAGLGGHADAGGDRRATIELIDVSDAAELRLSFGDTHLDEARIDPGQVEPVDLTGDGAPDIRVAVHSLDPESSPPSAGLRLKRAVQQGSVAAWLGSEDMEGSQRNDTAESRTDIDRETDVVADRELPSQGGTTEDARRRDRREIAAASRGPLQVDLAFSGPVLLRYSADGGETEQSRFDDGDELQLEAEEWIRLGASNAGHVRIRVSDEELELGPAGTVRNELLVRERSEDATQESIYALPLY